MRPPRILALARLAQVAVAGIQQLWRSMAIVGLYESGRKRQENGLIAKC
jgi:hypothetical protein